MRPLERTKLGHMSEEDAGDRCECCSGRGWKYITPRRGLFLVLPDRSGPVGRVRGDCSACGGSGRGRSAA